MDLSQEFRIDGRIGGRIDGGVGPGERKNRHAGQTLRRPSSGVPG
jgi:hypothetical protein